MAKKSLLSRLFSDQKDFIPVEELGPGDKLIMNDGQLVEVVEVKPTTHTVIESVETELLTVKLANGPHKGARIHQACLKGDRLPLHSKKVVNKPGMFSKLAKALFAPSPEPSKAPKKLIGGQSNDAGK